MWSKSHQLLELTASSDQPGEAVVIESTSVKGLGNVADCVVRWGTLKIGDHFVVGKTVIFACARLIFCNCRGAQLLATDHFPVVLAAMCCELRWVV